MEENERFCQNPEFICRAIAGETLLVPTGKTAQQFSGLVSLNGTGRFLWELLAQPQTAATLWTALAAEYELAEEVARRDTADFLTQAAEKNVVLRC